MPSLSKEAALVHEALVARGLETPLRPPVHEMDNETRKSLIAGHMTEIMQLLNLDLADDSLMETPHRIAKMYVDEIFSGLDYANFPKITLIENKMKVDEMVTVRDITLTSTCEHHFVTIDGKATVAYIPKDSVIGLSKINRIVQFFAQRPQATACAGYEVWKNTMRRYVRRGSTLCGPLWLAGIVRPSACSASA